MNILILGAGAMGSLYGALLARAGYDVTLLDVDKEKVKAINTSGIQVTGIEEFSVRSKAISEPPSISPDLIFIFTKSYSTEDALRSVKQSVTKDTILVTLQNGIGNEEVVRRYSNNVIGGITTYSAVLEKPGEVRWTGKGIIIIGGYPKGTSQYVNEVHDILLNAGFDIDTTSNVIGWKWLKAIVNSAINPVGALLKVSNGYILRVDILKQLALDIVKEGSIIARKKQVKLPRDPNSMLIETLEDTGENYNSMLQDLMQCKKTEIDYINGKIVETARDIGLNAPLNRTLWSLVKASELRCTSLVAS